DFAVIKSVCEAVKKVTEMGVEVGIVVGGGNFWRGAKDGGGKMERSRADHMGMLATVMNSLALSDVFEQIGVPVRVQTAIHMAQIAEPYIRLKADSHLTKGKVVIFGCGTGNPYFSTDTAAVLRAAEIGAEAILLAKNIDGVYSADPKVDPDAIKYDHISYDDVLAQHLAVMDTTATSLSMDNHIPVIVFALKDPENIVRVVMGEDIGTKVN
ncbi:MAG: UMP kinase, partial [Oscillospiraceae bacterium]|nr:UMP kinase [Oscillospiraceae bacterium]